MLDTEELCRIEYDLDHKTTEMIDIKLNNSQDFPKICGISFADDMVLENSEVYNKFKIDLKDELIFIAYQDN